jgi:myo-inositol 2-dehydrogenase / D-chiro-inositol 1-dehydrogenase
MQTSGPPPARPFRLGLIGAGRMGRAHLAALAGSDQVTVAGIADPEPGARETASQAGTPGYATVPALLAAGRLDGVVIAAPTSLHAAVVAEVTAAGLPVLCEKPCGLDAGQAAACAAAAAAAGVLLQVAYWRRFVPALAALRRRIQAGELGSVLAVNCYQWDEAAPPAAFRAASGGVFADMGVHEFDQIRWLTGQEFGPVRVAGSALPGEAGQAGDPDCAQLVATLDGGATAMVSLGRWHPAGDSCWVEVFGTAGTARCDFLPAGGGDAPFRGALRLQAEDFARAARGLAPAGGATAQDAVAALTLAGQAAEQLPVPSPPTR